MKNTIEITAKDNSAWFRNWFDSSFYHQLYGHRDEKEAAAFINELLIELNTKPNANILDLGCGAGRHAKYLASKDFMVTGLDLAASSIRQAKKSEAFNLRFSRHDMREPFGNNHFDYVFNFFTSFGYFKEENENHKVIRNIFNALKPGGTVVMDYINVAYSEERLVAEEKKEIDGIAYHISRWSDSNHFFKKIVINDIQAEGEFEYVEQVAKLNLDDFNCMFIRNGLKLQKVFGDYNLNDYDTEKSPRLIVIAKKS